MLAGCKVFVTRSPRHPVPPLPPCLYPLLPSKYSSATESVRKDKCVLEWDILVLGHQMSTLIRELANVFINSIIFIQVFM